MDIVILEVMIKNLFCCFCANTQFSFLLSYRGVGGEICMWGKWRVKRLSINRVRGDLSKYRNMWVILLSGHSLTIIKWNSMKFFPEIGKRHKVIRKGFYFLWQWYWRYHKLFSKARKVFSQQPMPFKSNASLDSNASQYSEAIKACKKFASLINR